MTPIIISVIEMESMTIGMGGRGWEAEADCTMKGYSRVAAGTGVVGREGSSGRAVTVVWFRTGNVSEEF